jgi:hypothetical protein
LCDLSELFFVDFLDLVEPGEVVELEVVELEVVELVELVE